MGMPPKLDGHEQNYGKLANCFNLHKSKIKISKSIILNIKITNVFSLMLYIMFQIL